MFKSKKYRKQILHYLLRHPCAKRLEILCTIGGESRVVLNCLGDLYGKGIVKMRYTDVDGGLFYINDKWLDYALGCKGGY